MEVTGVNFSIFHPTGISWVKQNTHERKCQNYFIKRVKYIYISQTMTLN